ncbi:MAG: DVUA0089 family protein, partial [Verrucomicrobia bacterium]|nr:DVUA0089 family protein [Verrucomicrobiota bacterium]
MAKLDSSFPLSVMSVAFVLAAIYSANAETEPNGTRAQANAVALNGSGQGSASGKIAPLADLDFYSIVTPGFSGSGTVTITMTPTAADQGLDAWIQLQDASGNQLAQRDVGFDNTPETLIVTNVTGSTTYYIVCRSADFSDAGAGDYTLQVTVAAPRPNLLPYQPNGWSDKIVVSGTTGTTNDSTGLTPADILYVDWAVINGGNAPVTNGFYTVLYVDGVSNHSWFANPPLNVNFYVSVQDYSIGSLSAGTHTIQIVTDATGTVGETDGTDNGYTKTITIVDDSNDQISEAIAFGAITQTRTNLGTIGSPTDVDMFSFTVQAGQRISFDIDQASAGFDSYIRLFNGSGTQLAFSDDNRGPGETNSQNSYLEFTFTNAGTFYLGVSGFGNTNYNATTGTGDTAGSTGSYTLVVSPGLAGTIRRPGDAADYPVDFLRFGAVPPPINPNLRTWIVIHGWRSSRTNSNINELANDLFQTRPGDQILTLDWSSAANTDLANAFDAANSIIPVAQWAANVLTNYGFAGTNINLIGHSFGSYVADEIAQRMPGGVNTIVSLDPAANTAPTAYDPVSNNEVNFARDSQFSWSFHASSLGNEYTPATADAAFIVESGTDSLTAHGNVVFLFAYLLSNPNDVVGRFFLLTYLLNATPGPWLPNQFVSSFLLDDPVQGYEAVIETANAGLTPQSIVFVDNAAPLLAVISITNSQTVTTNLLTVSGTATDSTRGNNGVASVFVNGIRANNDTAGGTG